MYSREDSFTDWSAVLINDKSMMNKPKQITRDNHTVPQFYLRRWSKNGNSINCYHTIRHNRGQRKWTSAAIKNMPIWRDIYTLDQHGELDDSIEQYFCHCEERASQAVAKLESQHALTRNELLDLVDFAIAQMVRTPSWATQSNDIIANSFESVSHETFQKLLEEAAAGILHPITNDTRDMENPDAPPFPPPPLDIEINEDCNEIVTRLRIGQTSSLYAMGRALTGDVAKTMRKHSWSLLEMPNSLELPTSDNPFVRLAVLPSGDIHLDVGVGIKGALLFMPITPRYLLATEVGFGAINPAYFDNENNQKLIIWAIANNAHRYIFASVKDPSIEAIRPSIVDPEYLQSLSQAQSDWMGS